MSQLKQCPACQVDEVYQYKGEFEYSGVGEELLPKLGKGVFGVAKIRPIVCASCGYIGLMASGEAIDKMKASEHWKKL